MTKVTADQKTEGRPQLKPDKFQNADVLVATIAGVEFKESQFRKGSQPVLTFKEPDFARFELRVGKRGTARLTKQFGDETDEWIGETIPLVKAREEIGTNTFIVYQVAPVEEWAALLKRAKKR